MARLPVPGADDNAWGQVLNDFLSAAHNSDGTLKTGISGSLISDGTIAEAKLDSALQAKVNAVAGNPAMGGDLTGTASNAQIAANAVGATELSTNAVSTAKLQDGSVTDTKLASGSVTSAKLGAVSPPTSGQLLSHNGTSLEWVTGTSATALNDLSDVNTASASDGQSLVYQSGSWAPATVTGGGGVTDHGALTGLSDDDHTQYHNNARGDARYYTQAQVDSALGAKVSTSAIGANNGVASLDGTGKVPTSQLPASSGIPASTVTTKGDLIVATGASTVTRLAAAANGQALITDSTTGTGLKYAAVRAISVGDTAPTGTINTGDVWIDTSGA